MRDRAPLTASMARDYQGPAAGSGDRAHSGACVALGRVADRHGAGRAGQQAQEAPMATGETGFDDVQFDLISVQYHSLKAGHDYGQYVRDAENAGLDDVASFFEEVISQDSERAHR